MLIQIRQDFFLIPNVIARGEDVHTPVEEFVRDLRSDAKTRRGIFAIENREIDCMFLLQPVQVLVDDRAARPGDRIADE